MKTATSHAAASNQTITVSWCYDKVGNLRYYVYGNDNPTQHNARGLVTHRVEPGGISGQNIDMAKTMRYFYYAGGRETAYTFDAADNRLTETVTVDNSDTTTWYAYLSFPLFSTINPARRPS